MASQHDLATTLLGLAADDLAAAKTLLDAESSGLIVGFHCQQAVEKALKAVLAVRGADFPYTHDVGLLIQLCEDAATAPPEELRDIDRLTPFAVQARYSGVQVPDLALESALAWVDETLEWSRAQLESSETTEQRAQDPPH
jgi:HEPN domain-containing protein